MRNNPMDSDGPSGVLLIGKAEDMTSHDVVAIARRALNTKKIGHCGTLIQWRPACSCSSSAARQRSRTC